MKRISTLLYPAFFITAGLGLVLAGCDIPPSFGPEYYDASINYIAGYPLSAPSADADAAGRAELDQTGAWDWSWRGHTDSAFNYMTLQPAGTVEAAAISGSWQLPAGTAVWQLDLANLFDNGAFEGELAAAQYEANEGRFSRSTATGHGNSLRVDLPVSGSEYPYINIQKALLDQPVNGSVPYYLRMMYWGIELSFAITESFPVGPSIVRRETPIADSIFITDYFLDWQKPDQKLVFWGINASFFVDELRVVRDLAPYLRLLLNPSETSPTLVPGAYEFSVWVKLPPGSKTFNDPTRSTEPLTSRSLRLEMNQLVYTGGDTGYQVKPWSATVEPGSEWQRVSLRTGSSQQKDNLQIFDEASERPILELRIAPTDISAMDAGSVLIALPNLNYHIGGFKD